MKANRKFKNENEAVSAVIGVILMVAITVAIAATVYVYVSGMLGTPTATAPKISWTPNAATNVLTITKGATDTTYGSTTGEKNLIFKNSTGEYCVVGVKPTLNISNSTTSLCTQNIDGGDLISGFGDGTYTIIWKPTNEVLGTVSF
ncbi:MAG: type IV pilin [Thermoplasmatota archaeon]